MNLVKKKTQKISIKLIKNLPKEMILNFLSKNNLHFLSQMYQMTQENPSKLRDVFLMNKTVVLIMYMLLFSTQSYASGLDYWGVEANFYTSKQNILENSVYNFQNSYLKLPDYLYKWNFKPDLKYSVSDLQITMRPYLISVDSAYAVNNGEMTESSLNKLQWNEVFITYSPSETFKLFYGLQNYQWGPADASSPSNIIFNDTILLKDSLIDIYGKHILRMNLSMESGWNEVLMAELSDNKADSNHPEFEAQEKFAKKILLKTDWTWNRGANYLGVVVGWRERFGFKLGEYFNYEITDGFTIYIDASQKKGSLAWYPQTHSNDNLIEWQQRQLNSKQLFNYMVAGAKYAFENGNDIRLEGIYQEDGYTSNDFSNAKEAFSSTQLQQKALLASNLEKMLYNGLYFPGQKYLLLALTSPNTFQYRNWLISLRDLYSLTDKSSSLYLYTEKSWGTQMTVFFHLLHNSGIGGDDDASDLKKLIADVYTVGLKYNW